MASFGTKDFTLSERKQIEELIKEGICTENIAARIGRSWGGTKNEIKRCGGRSNYSAEKAHHEALLRKEIRIGKLKNTLKRDISTPVNDLIQKGYSFNKIIKEVRISSPTLRKYMSESGQHFKYMPLEDRVSALEQQVEIILSIIESKGDTK
jgi:IS30 family transposase